MAWVEEEMLESLRLQQVFLKECAGTLSAICIALSERLERGGKLLLFGNEEARRTLRTSLRNLWDGISLNVRRCRRWL
jgi:phosphoheptose isomerase